MTTQTKVQSVNGEGVAEVGTEAEVAPSREMTAWEKLRAPFPPEKIGKLPKAGCKLEDWKALPKGKCSICHGWHATSKTIHLDFIGHADVTDRLLAVDPLWNWEPLSFAEDGLPRFVRNGTGAAIGLWIKLTVGGTFHFPDLMAGGGRRDEITRLGYGTVEPGAFDAEKQLIGDALRNAAMRFGVGLDLWRKEFETETQPATRDAVRASTAAPAPTGPVTYDTETGLRQGLLHALMAMPGEPRMTILQSFGYRSTLALNQWIAQLDEDVVAKVTSAIVGGDVDPDTIPF